MAPGKDPYELLNVPRGATSKEIRKAYRQMALTTHPDVSDAPNANEIFKEITEAYAVLFDEKLRADYDRQSCSSPSRSQEEGPPSSQSHEWASPSSRWQGSASQAGYNRQKSPSSARSRPWAHQAAYNNRQGSDDRQESAWWNKSWSQADNDYHRQPHSSASSSSAGPSFRQRSKSWSSSSWARTRQHQAYTDGTDNLDHLRVRRQQQARQSRAWWHASTASGASPPSSRKSWSQAARDTRGVLLVLAKLKETKKWCEENPRQMHDPWYVWELQAELDRLRETEHTLKDTDTWRGYWATSKRMATGT